MSLIQQRRESTKERLAKLVDTLDESTKTLENKGCVYLTGSAARGELNLRSDLDLFILGSGSSERRRLTRLDEIIIKADLIKTTRAQGFPPFSGDGKYLTVHFVSALRESLGQSNDDSSNTFTARLLLLLESRALLGSDVYQEAIDDVLWSYWRDYEDHKSDFMPTFLVNDILRLWKTFCVNYEANTRDAPSRERAERKLKNYKLKHSRVLTCYSAIIYLAQVYKERETVSPQEAKEMVAMSPSERLEWLRPKIPGNENKVNDLLARYEDFLQKTDSDKESLIDTFNNKETAKALLMKAREFGDKLFDLVRLVSGDNFFRYLVV